MFGLQSNLPFPGETWERLRKLDFAGRLEAIHDAGTCGNLIDEAKAQKKTWISMADVYYLGDAERPDYTVAAEHSLKAMAEAAGEHWAETFLRISRESRGRGLFNLRMFNKNLKELGDLFRSEHCFPSLGDAGAAWARRSSEARSPPTPMLSTGTAWRRSRR